MTTGSARLSTKLFGKRSSLSVQLQLIVELIADELDQPDEPTLNYLAGALFQLVFWWLAARKPLPPAELDALFRRLVGAGTWPPAGLSPATRLTWIVRRGRLRPCRQGWRAP